MLGSGNRHIPWVMHWAVPLSSPKLVFVIFRAKYPLSSDICAQNSFQLYTEYTANTANSLYQPALLLIMLLWHSLLSSALKPMLPPDLVHAQVPKIWLRLLRARMLPATNMSASVGLLASSSIAGCPTLQWKWWWCLASDIAKKSWKQTQRSQHGPECRRRATGLTLHRSFPPESGGVSQFGTQESSKSPGAHDYKHNLLHI